ncbi:MAG: hypothetical protein IT320_16480, partial [Anaerolineae bacterium]|nr:hypothetical protein [Anaerolineae bacterium]
MTELLDRLGIDSQTDLARLAVFVAILILTWVGRRIAAYLLRRLIHVLARAIHLVGRRQIDVEAELVEAFTAPVKLLVTILGVRLSMFVFEFDAGMTRFIAGLFAVLLAYTFFWALYRLAGSLGAYFIHVAENTTSRLDETITRFSSQVIRVI